MTNYDKYCLINFVNLIAVNNRLMPQNIFYLQILDDDSMYENNYPVTMVFDF